MQRSTCAEIALVLGAMWTATGCLDLGFGEWLSEWDEPDQTSGNLEVQRASLQGAVGPVGQLDHAATEVEAWSSRDETEVTVIVDTGRGAGMTRVEIDGPLDHPQVREGDRVLVYDSAAPARGGDVDVRVLGCAGPQPHNWHYDSYADRALVWVERRRTNPRVLRYIYQADFSYSPSYSVETTRVTGMFDVLVD